MQQHKYATGEIVRINDCVFYPGGLAIVVKLLDAFTQVARDWDESFYYTGGIVIRFENGQELGLSWIENEEDLLLVSRGKD